MKKYLKQDNEMAPVSDTYLPVNPISVEVFEFVKTEYPEAYQDMQNGIEIGFKKYVNEYKKATGQTVKKNK